MFQEAAIEVVLLTEVERAEEAADKTATGANNPPEEEAPNKTPQFIQADYSARKGTAKFSLK